MFLVFEQSYLFSVLENLLETRVTTLASIHIAQHSINLCKYPFPSRPCIMLSIASRIARDV